MKAHKIKRVFVGCSGDPSVGISGRSVTVEADGDFMVDLDQFDKADRSEVLETFRGDLRRAFRELWGESVAVVFDFEDQRHAGEEATFCEHCGASVCRVCGRGKCATGPAKVEG